MDGNGRWAQKRGQLRTQGHLEGLKTAKQIVKAASDMGLSYLTLYTFSTENWKRTAEEVGFIMNLVIQYLRSELDFCIENNVRVLHAGDREALPKDVLLELDDTCSATKHYDGMTVILALNYGGRDEIVRAVKRIISAAETVSEENISRYLDNPGVPDPDLIIRTGGEFRTSNFLLWESAYSEYFISGKLWPDWKSDDLADAIAEFGNRKRRFGAAPGEAI
jgi:undecaprenyl diphosphate synthase